MGRFKRNSPGCKCCGVPPCHCTSIVTTDCGSSTPDVFYYTFTMSGLANDFCTSCTTWNGDHKLCWAGGDTWRSLPHATSDCGHTPNDPLYTLVRSGGYYVLEAAGLGYQWRLATGSWQCAKPNTLAVVSPGPAQCTGVPATVVLTPCYVCSYCDPSSTFPSRAQIDIVGTANAGCAGDGILPGCDYFNSTFVLNRVSNLCQLVKNWRATPSMRCMGLSAYNGSWWDRHVAYVSGFPGNYGWYYEIQMRTNVSGQTFYIRFKYTNAAKFDCSVARTLTFQNQSLPFCNWSGATVTLTPL